MKFFSLWRYGLEVISVPIFAFLVFHLIGEGLGSLTTFHAHEEAHAHGSLFDLDFWLSFETLGGILLLYFFVKIWHMKGMKKLVPCAHSNCSHKTIWPHLAATGAFVFHFFPESTLRHEILLSFSVDSFLSILGVLGFLSHFLVDIIIALMLSIFWGSLGKKILSFLVISIFWGLAFYVGEKGLHFEGIAQSIVLLVSGFLLAMFIHKPHKH